MGKSYYQVEGLQEKGFTAHQVAEGNQEAATPVTPQVSAATTTQSPEKAQLAVLLDMVKGLQATVSELQRNQAGRRTPLARDEPTHPLQLTCWGCGASGHVRRHCSKGSLSLNNQGSR